MADRLEPRFVDNRAIKVAGLRGRFGADSRTAIPALWQRMVASLSQVQDKVGFAAYGLCFPMESGFDYLADIEIAGTAPLPNGWTVVTVPAGRYAVFPHDGHASTIWQTMEAIGGWLRTSGHQHAFSEGAPGFFEHYGEKFDPRTGTGDIEIWMPLDG